MLRFFSGLVWVSYWITEIVSNFFIIKSIERIIQELVRLCGGLIVRKYVNNFINDSCNNFTRGLFTESIFIGKCVLDSVNFKVFLITGGKLCDSVVVNSRLINPLAGRNVLI